MATSGQFAAGPPIVRALRLQEMAVEIDGASRKITIVAGQPPVTLPTGELARAINESNNALNNAVGDLLGDDPVGTSGGGTTADGVVRTEKKTITKPPVCR
jgi:hypothetical protein